MDASCQQLAGQGERAGAPPPLTAEGTIHVEWSHEPCLRQLKHLTFLYRCSSAQEPLNMESFRENFQRNGLGEGFLFLKGRIEEV